MLGFDDIRGQAHAIGFLRTAWSKGRLPHAMIFAGREGVGKKTTAEALAALALCPNPKGDRPCGVCVSCKAMAAGTHPDHHYVYRQLIRLDKDDAKARDLSIHVIREFVNAPAAHSAQLNHGKSFVIEEAELMNASAQNGLLKTLEEPGPGTIIILLTSRPGDLLPTIRSRCQLVQFALLPDELVENELRARDIPPAQASQAAMMADGSLGLALAWAKDGVAARAADLGRKLTDALAGNGRFAASTEIKAAADAYAEGQLKKDELASRDQANREGMVLYLDLAARQARALLRGEPDADQRDRLCDIIELIAEVADQIEGNVNAGLALRRLELKISTPPRARQSS